MSTYKKLIQKGFSIKIGKCGSSQISKDNIFYLVSGFPKMRPIGFTMDGFGFYDVFFSKWDKYYCRYLVSFIRRLDNSQKERLKAFISNFPELSEKVKFLLEHHNSHCDDELKRISIEEIISTK